MRLPPGIVVLAVISGVASACGAATATATKSAGIRQSTDAPAHMCHGPQLRGSATLPIPGAGSDSVTFSFRNVSLVRCTLEGYPRLQMRNAHDRPLPTITVHAGGTPQLITLAHGASALVYAGWPLPRHSCAGPRATLVVVRLPRVSKPIDVPVGSANQPFDPCKGTIGVSPLEQR